MLAGTSDSGIILPMRNTLEGSKLNFHHSRSQRLVFSGGSLERESPDLHRLWFTGEILQVSRAPQPGERSGRPSESHNYNCAKKYCSEGKKSIFTF